jgi:glycoprotein endo-alpha-1,2-mannosidase
VHAFYYLWYGNPETDGRWTHWNHSVLPHWTAAIRARYPEAAYLPPADVHSAFYPTRGLYSSASRATVAAHMLDMRTHGITTAVVSWWGRPGASAGDSQGIVTEGRMLHVLDAAAEAGMRVALHLEPYEGRSVESVALDLFFLSHAYGAHPALLRVHGRVVAYVYDSYHISPSDWARLFREKGDLSVRGSAADVFAIGLWLDAGHGKDLAAGGFDGMYTYFGVDGFSWGSSTANWPAMAEQARASGLSLSLCVGPGYDDSRIRPWNIANRRDREGGAYYRRMWAAALAERPDFVSVSTYNEWGEGTQIEAAASGRSVDVDALAPLGQALDRGLRTALGLLDDGYADYKDEGGPQAYMEMTREFALLLQAERGDQEL